MVNLRSVMGVYMLSRYVINWYSVLLVYLNLKKQVLARFKDGSNTHLSKSEPNEFYENLYTRYLEDNGFKFQREGEYRKVILPQGMQLLIKEPLYAFVLDEVFLMKSYGEYNLQNRPVIDVGATIADSAIYFHLQGANRIYGFEISKTHYETALKNVHANGLDDIIVLYNEPATADKINQLIQEKNLDNIFVKMDCEGCEHEIVSRIDFRHIQDIVLEYHGEPNDLLTTFEAAGFKTTKKAGMIYASKAR